MDSPTRSMMSDVSVAALSGQTLSERGPKVMRRSVLPCVWFAGLSATLPELR